MSRTQRSRIGILAMCLVLGLCAASVQAGLLNVNLVAPTIDYGSNGHLSYDPTSGQFNIDATPLAITFADTSLAFIDAPRSLGIRLLVDTSGLATSNGAVDDLTVQGMVDVDGDGVADYSGVLLTGQIKLFGFQYSGTPTASFDCVFRVTGGSLAGLYADGDIGLTITSENSMFTGSFGTGFAGKAKGVIGLVPVIKVSTRVINGRVTCAANGAGVADATVSVLDANNNVVATTVTDAEGGYGIGNLPAATYSVTVTAPVRTKLCGEAAVNVSVVDENAVVDFCVCPVLPSNISGKVTCSRDGGSIAGVTITVLDAGNVVAGTAQTQADGTYSIGGLYAGSYSVKITPIENTTLCGAASMPVTLVTETDGTADFCLCPCEGSTIAGMVSCKAGPNAGPQAGVTVTAYDSMGATAGEATTGADGSYVIASLPPGTYSVTVTVPPKYEACDDLTKIVTLLCEQDGTADFCLCPPVAPPCVTKITGKVKSSSGCQTKPVEGATIQVVDKSNSQVVATQTTAADGTYTVTGLPAGNYLVKITVPDGYKANSCTSVCLTLACSQTKNVDFCLYPDCTPAKVTGTVKASCKTISGTVIKAYDANNVEKGSATTGCYGTYGIGNLPAGTYTIKITAPDGYKVSGSASVSVTLTSGQSKVVDFSLTTDISPAKVTGTVKTSCKPVAGVVVKAYDSNCAVKGSAVTGSDGTYTIGNLAAGNYTIKITVPAGYKTSSGTSASVSLCAGQTKDVDFWLYVECSPAKVTGTVKASCKGLAGVTVKAFDGKNVEKGSAVTGCDGKYTIGNLPAGHYTIKITVPNGYKACGECSACISLSAGQSKCVDFSVAKVSSGCGYK